LDRGTERLALFPANAGPMAKGPLAVISDSGRDVPRPLPCPEPSPRPRPRLCPRSAAVDERVGVEGSCNIRQPGAVNRT
jgi:hypothetical protein